MLPKCLLKKRGQKVCIEYEECSCYVRDKGRDMLGDIHSTFAVILCYKGGDSVSDDIITTMPLPSSTVGELLFIYMIVY